MHRIFKWPQPEIEKIGTLKIVPMGTHAATVIRLNLVQYILTDISRRHCFLTLGREESVAWWWASPSWSSPSSSPSSPPAFVTAAAALSSPSPDHFRFYLKAGN